MAYTLKLFDDDRKLDSTLVFSDSTDAIKKAATHTLRSGGLSILRDGEQIIFVSDRANGKNVAGDEAWSKYYDREEAGRSGMLTPRSSSAKGN